jgi:predicted MFS family arabinose efflux permease
VTVLFLMHGVLTGGWAPHIPLAKEKLGVGTGVFGWILLGLAAGGVLAMPAAGALIHRIGSAAVCRACGLGMCLSFAFPVYAESEFALLLALLLFGAALGALDVAMNAHGVAVEQRLGRAVMSAFHGWYSVGAALGAGLGGLAVDALGPSAHVAATLAVSSAMLVFSSRRLLPPTADKGFSGSHFAWPTRATLGLGALAFLALLVEGATLDWSALHLTQNVGAPAALAGFGFAVFSAGMAATRFAGDALRMRFGCVPLVRASALALAAGMAAAIAIPHPVLALLAFAVAGLGVGNIAPVLFAGGGRAEPDAPGRGIAAVTTLGYSGFLLGPPAIGMVAEWTGLRPALALTVAAALVIAVFARAARAADGPRGP